MYETEIVAIIELRGKDRVEHATVIPQSRAYVWAASSVSCLCSAVSVCGGGVI
jgi:hypothetical protein